MPAPSAEIRSRLITASRIAQRFGYQIAPFRPGMATPYTSGLTIRDGHWVGTAGVSIDPVGALLLNRIATATKATPQALYRDAAGLLNCQPGFVCGLLEGFDGDDMEIPDEDDVMREAWDIGEGIAHLFRYPMARASDRPGT